MLCREYKESKEYNIPYYHIILFFHAGCFLFYNAAILPILLFIHVFLLLQCVQDVLNHEEEKTNHHNPSTDPLYRPPSNKRTAVTNDSLLPSYDDVMSGGV